MPSQIQSPILPFMQSIADSCFRLAPERTACLQSLVDLHRFEIELVNEKFFSVRVLLDQHKILLPVSALEYLWTCCLRYWVIAVEYGKTQHEGKSHFDVYGNDRLKNSADIISWGFNNMQKGGTEDWPQALPKPCIQPIPQSDEHVANELFVGAMGWILLHEIAHIELRHSHASGVLSQKEEKEADLFATRWVLDGMNENDPCFRKRAYCIAAALLCLQSLELGSTSTCGHNHPPAYERLDYCLSPYRTGGEWDKINAFMVSNLQLLYSAAGVKANTEGETLATIIDDMLFDFSRKSQS